MTLPVSGQIALSQVNVELGRSSAAQISLGESAVRALAGVPTGQIMLSDLYGKSAAGPVDPIPAIEIGDSELSPTNPTATLTVRADGTVAVVGNASSTGGNWYAPTTAGIGSGYWVRMTKLSGIDPTSGEALGSWLQLSSNRSWTWTRTVNGTTTATVKIEIASASGGSPIVATEASIPVSVSREL